MNKLGLIQPQGTGLVPAGTPKAEPVQGSGFGKILEDSVAAVNNQMQEAESLSEGLMAGRHSNIHETMIAMEKADLSFRMLTKVQGKVIDAYNEVMRLQL